MKLIPTLALLLLTSLPALARLGETKAECGKRYGKPAHTLSTGDIAYEKAGMNIIVTFSKDKAVKIIFSKADPEHVGEVLPLSATELDTLLKANAGTAKWTEVPTSIKNSTSWSLGDDKAMASYDTASKCLNIVEMDFMMNPSENEAEAKKLDGF